LLKPKEKDNYCAELVAMAFTEKTVVFLLPLLMAAFQVSHAAVHKVGDSSGWTIIGNIDYRKWAATKNFQVGDTISKSPHLTPILNLCSL